ncbi:hypothetical protein Dimus_033374, partial [Dionaea muscipula]
MPPLVGVLLADGCSAMRRDARSSFARRRFAMQGCSELASPYAKLLGAHPSSCQAARCLVICARRRRPVMWHSCPRTRRTIICSPSPPFHCPRTRRTCLLAGFITGSCHPPSSPCRAAAHRCPGRGRRSPARLSRMAARGRKKDSPLAAVAMHMRTYI